MSALMCPLDATDCWRSRFLPLISSWNYFYCWNKNIEQLRHAISCCKSERQTATQCCGSASLWCGCGSYLSPVLWNRNYFLRFGFRFRLLKSYGSGSDFRKSYGSGSYFRKVTVPVPVPAPYLDHKKQIFQKTFVENILPFYTVSCFTRKKFINLNKFIVKYE